MNAYSSKLQERADTIVGLETTKALLMKDVQELTNSREQIKELLRLEQQECASASQQNKALGQQLRKVVADAKTYVSIYICYLCLLL